MMAHLRNLLVNIRNANLFALIANETQDINGLEQFAISLRWVDDSYMVHEDFNWFSLGRYDWCSNVEWSH